MAEALYMALRHSVDFMRRPARRWRAWRTIDMVLRRLSLPPAYVPKLRVPSTSWVEPARAAIRLCAEKHPIRAAGAWIAERAMVMVGRVPRWSDKVDAPALFFSAADKYLMTRPPMELAALARGASLRDHDGPWRLPLWPKRDDVKRRVKKSWAIFSTALRCGYWPREMVMAGAARLEQSGDRLGYPEPPAAWA